MGVIVIIISVIVVISIVAKSKKSKIWVPGPFVGTWKNDKYRVILRENSIQIWNNEIGMLDLPSYIIEQGYRGGYSFIAKKGQEIFSVNFIETPLFSNSLFNFLNVSRIDLFILLFLPFLYG